MATPSSVYQPSSRHFPSELPAVTYPGHFETRRVSGRGFFDWKSNAYYLSESLCRASIGLEEIDEQLWRVYFGSTVIGLLCDRRPELGLIFPGSKALQQLLPMYPDTV